MAKTSEWVSLISNVAWPAAVVAIVGMLLTQRGRLLLRPILRRLRALKGPGGWGIELSEDAAAETKSDVEGAIKSYAPALDSEFQRLAHVEGIFSRLETAVQNVLQPDERDADSFRATVHVEDALVRSALYQLVNYWPSGPGAGRRFSVRFGILGRAWRLGHSVHEPEAPTDEDHLIESWGMTRAQARSAAVGKRSFVSIVLMHEGQRVGILFMDAKPAKAFQAGVEARFDGHTSTLQLAAAVGRVRQTIGNKGPAVKLLDDD